MIKIRPLIEVLGKIIKLPKDSYIDPSSLGSGTADATTVLKGDSTWGSIPSSVNIYNTNGILTGNRTVTMNSNTLLFDGTNSYVKYTPNSAGGYLQLEGKASGVPRFSVSIPPYLTKPLAGFQLGMRAWDDATFPGYGKIGDAFFYAGNETNGLNFMNPVGTGTEDYIRFYAGNNASATSDIHIQGTGATRGNVGIGTEAPTEKLDVSGKTKTTTFQMTTAPTAGYVLTSDASGNGIWSAITLEVPNEFVFVSAKSDLPTPVAGVITLAANYTYFFTTTVDLTGDRLVCGSNTTILGASSENCRIKSTGLMGTALITSVYSMPMRHITIEADIALNLDGDGTTTALDWFGVNFTDCATIGTIKDYTNFIMGDSAFLNSGGLTFDGTIGTIGMSNCLFDCRSTKTAITLASTLSVSRRFRIIYSSFVILSGETGINVSTSATISDERYVLDTVNFSGGGTYVTGITHTSNKALFTSCVGITNTTTRGFYYMVNNTTDTTIGVLNVNVWVKAAGTTTASVNNSKFTHSNNMLTYTGSFSTSFLIVVNANVRSSATNQVISIGIAKNGTILNESEMTIRTAVTNQEYPGSTQVQLELISTDFIELFVRNTTSSNVRVSDLNVSIIKIPA